MDNMITLCGPLEDDCHRKEHNKEELKAFIEWADKNNLPTARDHGIFWWRKTQEAWERWVKGNDTNVKK